MDLLKALMLILLVIGGIFAFPVFASTAIMRGDWSHVAVGAMSVVMATAISWLADGKIK
jgi:hypothetical protein